MQIGETGDPTQRLPPAGASDEVGALSETLNAMLASLERAREAERRFVADASHELRTPLTALRGNAAYIAQHGANAEVLSDLEGDARRLAHLLDDLLALAREDAAGPSSAEPVRLDRARARRAPARGSRSTPPRRSPSAAMQTRSRARSPTWSRTRSCTAPRTRRCSDPVREEVGRARALTVTDRGPGLSEEQTPSTHSSASGAHAVADAPRGPGLGLAIVRATAERHGGSVSVRGAAFTLDLPI